MAGGRLWRVAVVDDHAQVRKVIRTWLEIDERTEFAGEAADAAGAIELIRSGTIDAVLLDIELPGRNGLDVLRTIRREGSTTVVVIYSGHDPMYDEAMRLGADAFHSKSDALADVVDTICARCAARLD